MDISFSNSEIKKLCEDSRYAKKKLGNASAKKLRTRLTDLHAALRLGNVTAGQPHPLKGDRTGQFAVSLASGHRLVFKTSDDPKPLNAEGNLNWKEVKSIEIVFIGDYHD